MSRRVANATVVKIGATIWADQEKELRKIMASERGTTLSWLIREGIELLLQKRKRRGRK